MDDYRTYAHTPPHLYRPGSKYFITASAYQRRRLFDEEAKKHLCRSLFKACECRGWKVDDWVILDNHYHVMLSSPDGNCEFSTLIAECHKFTALFIKKHDPNTQEFKHIFSNYWDTCITHERSYFARLNYIYQNPAKHGYVQDAKDYQWGSYADRVRMQREYIERLISDFPCDRVHVEDEY
jgi:putative transposase